MSGRYQHTSYEKNLVTPLICSMLFQSIVKYPAPTEEVKRNFKHGKKQPEKLKSREMKYEG